MIQCKLLHFNQEERYCIDINSNIQNYPELKERVGNLAKRTRRSSGFYYNVLLEDYLSEIEDIYDAVDISEKVRAGKEKTYSSDELRKELGL